MIGIGKIIPGVSGSVLAILLGVYDKGVYALSHLQTEFKKNLLFLFKVGLGIFVSIVLGSQFVLSLLEHYYFTTMLLFCGLISGTIPLLAKKKSHRGKSSFALTLAIFALFTLLSFIKIENVRMIGYEWGDFLFLILVGFIEAATMIIPGISGTAVLMLLGVYELILTMFGHIFSWNYLKYNAFILAPFLIGIVLGFLTITKLVYYCMQKNEEKAWSVILGFSLSSLFLLLQKTLQYKASLIEWVLGIILFCTGFLVSLYFEKK
ncbi:MAG: DUF368 domain-containing protein [Bacilli bacterium]|nr:DUF368 domain-containing protein [Bacilli bacterium]